MEKYYKHKIENLLFVKKIVTVHYLELDKDFSYKGEKHDFWEIVYADKESIICTADNKEFLLNQGEIFFHKPNEFHSLKSNGKFAPNVFIISFECKSEAMKFFENKKLKLKKANLNYVYSIIDEAKKTFNIPVSNPKTKKMELSLNPALGGEQIIKNILEILLISIMRDETELNNKNKIFLQSSDFNSNLVNNIIEILNENIFGKISIEDICDKTAYSKSQIFKQFKIHTGKTIIEYYNFLKIEKAKQLVRENSLSIKEISDKLCFDTPNYFTKSFKKQVGSTPLKYKKFALSFR